MPEVWLPSNRRRLRNRWWGCVLLRVLCDRVRVMQLWLLLALDRWPGAEKLALRLGRPTSKT